MSGEPIISVKNLRKIFKVLERRPGFWGGLKTLFSADYHQVRAVDGVSFSIGAGELVGYIGPNGAGKSTTIKMLTGVLFPTDGEVLVDGLIPYEQRLRNSQNVGVVFGQRSQLVWDLPPRDTYELIRRLYAIPKDRYEVNLTNFIELLGLKDFLYTPVRQLSLGQRMRCELVASLLHDPKIVYLDEPTIGLDIIAKEKIREFIKEINQQRGITVLLTTHDLSDIEKLCKRVLIIDRGKILYDGDLAEIKDRFCRRRRLLFSLSDSRGLNELECEIKSMKEGISVDVKEYNSATVSFDPRKLPAAELIRYIINSYEVKDLSVEAADIEAIVREIYERGKVV